MSLPLIQAIVALEQHNEGAKGFPWDRLMDGLVLLVVVLVLIALVIGILWVGKKVMSQPIKKEGLTWLDYGPLWIVGLGIVASLLGFLVVVLAFIPRAGDVDATNVLALLAALFGIIGTLVGTYFGIRTSLETHDGLLKLVQDPGNTQALTVVAVNPHEGAEVNVTKPLVTATFSKAMDDTTITSETFKLAKVDTPPSTDIPGEVTYHQPSLQATLTPAADLDSGTYQATITTGVKDQGGNAITSEHTWKFTVN